MLTRQLCDAAEDARDEALVVVSSSSPRLLRSLSGRRHRLPSDLIDSRPGDICRCRSHLAR